MLYAMKKFKFLILGIFILLLSSCCTYCAKKTINLTESDSGKSIILVPGNRLEVALKGNYTTGYTWNIISYDKAILKLSSDSKYVAEQTQLIGAGGIQYYYFDVVGKGKAEIIIDYSRGWEKESLPVKSFILTLDSK